MSYPVHITNIYELLNEDGSENVPRANVGETKSSTSTARSSSTSSKPSTAQSAGKTQQGSRDPFKKSYSMEGGRGGQTGKQGDRPPRNTNRPYTQGGEENANADLSGKPFDRKGKTNIADGEHRGERKLRGTAAPAGGFVGNKRVYDRKSGTGRGKEMKKGGGGRGNWGREGEGSETAAPVENWEGEGEAPKEGAAVEEKVEEPVQLTPEEEEANRLAAEEREKESKMMTLEEYRKAKAAKGPIGGSLPSARKANEGVETSKFAQFEVKRDEDESAETEEKKEKKENKKFVDAKDLLNFRSAPIRVEEDRGFRGGRGGNRGGNRGCNPS